MIEVIYDIDDQRIEFLVKRTRNISFALQTIKTLTNEFMNFLIYSVNEGE